MSTTLKIAVQLAALSYKNPEVVMKMYENKETNLLKDCIQAPEYIYDPVSDAQLYLFETETIMYIAIRGTNSLIDVFQDLQIGLTDIQVGEKTCKVHEGAYRQFMALNAKMEEPVFKKLKENTKTIIFCSHSLGAMVSALFAVNICDQFSKRVEVYCFGCPRVGDKSFVNIFQELITKTTNVKNGCDPLTKIMIGNDYCALPVTNYGRLDLFPKYVIMTDLPDHDIVKYVQTVLADDLTAQPNFWQSLIIKAQGILPF